MTKLKLSLLFLSVMSLAIFVACSSETETITKEVEVIKEVMVEGKSTLKTVQDRGTLKCGVNDNLTGFGVLTSGGTFEGFDIDYCKAVAAAILGDASKVEYVPLTASARFEALSSGEIDMLVRNTTWTASRDRDLGNDFTATTFYDGQGMMVYADSGYKTIEDMNGSTVCVLQGTTTELNLDDRFTSAGLDYTPLTFETNDPLQAAFEEKRCDGWTTDKSGLNGRRTLLKNPKDHIIMEVTMSKEPLGPVVRHGDDQWFDIVQWTVFAMMQAEEFGITSGNVDTFLGSENPNIRKLLGEEGEMGQKLGLSDDWAYNIVKLVGNMGEAYDAHLGPNTATSIPRGLNRLYTDGGLMYPPPVR